MLVKSKLAAAVTNSWSLSRAPNWGTGLSPIPCRRLSSIRTRSISSLIPLAPSSLESRAVTVSPIILIPLCGLPRSSSSLFVPRHSYSCLVILIRASSLRRLVVHHLHQQLALLGVTADRRGNDDRVITPGNGRRERLQRDHLPGGRSRAGRHHRRGHVRPSFVDHCARRRGRIRALDGDGQSKGLARQHPQGRA